MNKGSVTLLIFMLLGSVSEAQDKKKGVQTGSIHGTIKLHGAIKNKGLKNVFVSIKKIKSDGSHKLPQKVTVDLTKKGFKHPSFNHRLTF